MSTILSLLLCSLFLCNSSPAFTNTQPQEIQHIESHTFSIIDANGVVILTAENLLSAKVKQIEQPPTCAVELFLTAEGQKIFAAASAQIALKPEGENSVTVSLDNAIISRPHIYETIDSPSILISGDLSIKEAQELADLINSGIQ